MGKSELILGLAGYAIVAFLLAFAFGWIRGQDAQQRKFDAFDVMMAAIWPLAMVGFVMYLLNVWGALIARRQMLALDSWWRDGDRQ